MPTNNIFNKFSNNYKKSLRAAAELAGELNHSLIEPEHILYGLITQRGSVGAELFTSLEVKTGDVKNSIAKFNQTISQIAAKTAPKFSDLAKSLIQKSVKIAYLNKHKYIGTEHLLAAILQINNLKIKKIFAQIKISEDDLTQQVLSVLKSASKLPDLTETFKVIDEQKLKEKEVESGFFPAPNSILDFFGADLTNEKFQKNIDPVIGREEEINRIIQILSRRTKNNPIILGDPGVGKTAIVEGLAKKIMLGEVPEALHHKKIYALDLTSTVAGTMYRGEFENRIKQIIDEVKNRPDLILFIDEIHNIVGTGSASGSMDAANILKPALARGEIHCIGATTFEDYRKTIESQPALDRRFQPVKISEPTAEETKNILLGIRSFFEKFHQIKISDNAIDTAIELSQKYLPEKFLPDKAIDLIDEASAAKKVNRKLSPQERQGQILKQQLADIQQIKKEAILKENFALALKLKKQATEINEQIAALAVQQENKKNEATDKITSPDIAKIISRMTGVPVVELAISEKRQILKLDDKLNEKIIGQNEAIGIIADFIKRAKAGLSPENKPLASFIFVGGSGVGKTYTAKILAQLMFGDEKALIKIDMSEYSERFNISKLIGAPAGYVGYKESGQLTEKIKHKPYSIVLFDEIEKADREVFDLLLQVLEDGYLTDAAGSRINFQNTIIIMTANIGSHHFKTNQLIGFSESSEEIKNLELIKENILKETKNYFKPEFLNRLDKIIYFNPLTFFDLQKIVKLELENLLKKLSRKNINLIFDQTVVKLIAQKSLGTGMGARGIKKTIQELIETSLSQKILKDEVGSSDTVRLSVKNGIIEIVKSS